MTGRSRWDDQKEESLRQHVANGGTAARASVIFRVSVLAVRAKAREIGCPFPTLREDRTKRTVQMAERTNSGDY